MKLKRIIFIVSIFLIFISIIGAYASSEDQSIDDVFNILNNTNSTELTGCCSVVCQLDGNNSITSFRRDAENGADIYIEKINWHGKPAIKQYKTDAGYFCQVIVTNDGWVIGYGGIDDGIDNQRIENITAQLVTNNKIDKSSLGRIQEIKNGYGLGHTVIKDPDGNYGVAMATTQFTGKLNPGDYLSVPNRYSYVRTGDIPLNDTDKVKTMTELASSDMFGLTRRDITTFYYHNVTNSTFDGNITSVYVSNDDGSMYGMDTGSYRDDVYFNHTLFKKENIPISPKYTTLGTMEFGEQASEPHFGIDIVSPLESLTGAIFYVLFAIHISCIIVFIIRLINNYRYAKRREQRRR